MTEMKTAAPAMNSLTITTLVMLAESKSGGLKLDAIRTITGCEVADISAAAVPLVERGLAEWRVRRGGKRTLDITDQGMNAAALITAWASGIVG